MLARLHVLLPFHLSIPDGQQFNVYEYQDAGYRVRVYPPMRSERAPAIDGPQQLKIDGVSAFQADVLRIDFVKDKFERGRATACDPPEDLLNRAVNSFLVRLRHVARAPNVRPLSVPSVTWRLQYLHDDETELEQDERYIRGRGVLEFHVSWTALTQAVWQDIYALPIDYEPPPWEGLLLDARAELPRIGPSVVLAATALEVFAAKILDKLAALKNTPPELWNWINERSDRLRAPSTEEQYDSLLKLFTGHSLKEEKQLWEAFMNLKSARNTFVHEGIARVGSAPIDAHMADRFINSAADVIQKVKEWVPKELHWPEFKHVIKLETLQKIR